MTAASVVQVGDRRRMPGGTEYLVLTVGELVSTVSRCDGARGPVGWLTDDLAGDELVSRASSDDVSGPAS